MNTNKWVATLVTRNHNNSAINTKESADMRNNVYNIISAIINLAKSKSLAIAVKADKFIVGCDTDKMFNPKHGIMVMKGSLHSEDLLDFFYGLKRTNNVTGYLSYYGHTKVETELSINVCNGSTSVVLKPIYS